MLLLPPMATDQAAEYALSMEDRAPHGAWELCHELGVKAYPAAKHSPNSPARRPANMGLREWRVECLSYSHN